jgi:hypothetical protein
MFEEDKVQLEFVRLATATGVAFTEPVREYEGAGEGSITYKCGVAFCKAQWWEHGCLFVLFLGRHFEVGGRKFVSEFPVAALEKAEKKPRDFGDVAGQIEVQFRILRAHGCSWLAGDFSQEPFVRHKVLPFRE